MGLLIRVLVSVAQNLVLTRDDALTTSNLVYVLLSPQGVLIIIIAIIVVLIYIAIELFGEIIFELRADIENSKFDDSERELIEKLPLAKRTVLCKKV